VHVSRGPSDHVHDTVIQRILMGKSIKNKGLHLEGIGATSATMAALARPPTSSAPQSSSCVAHLCSIQRHILYRDQVQFLETPIQDVPAHDQTSPPCYQEKRYANSFSANGCAQDSLRPQHCHQGLPKCKVMNNKGQESEGIGATSAAIAELTPPLTSSVPPSSSCVAH